MKKLIFLLLFLLPQLVRGQVIVTVAGNGTRGYNGDDIPATNAELDAPYGINIDDSGNLYICDVFNNRIRKVSPAYYGTITTIAGNGTAGYSGDGGLGIYAKLYVPIDVFVDRHGNVYIADGNNCIRKVTPADTITTIAGTGVAGYNGDGIAATSAQLNNPTGVCVDSLGNIYIADRFNNRIRKVDTAGNITTIAGTGIAGFSPDGSHADTARLDSVYNIRIDKSGNVFFEDDNARIRKIDTEGIITTIAGNGIYGYSGDNGMATAAEIGGRAIAIDRNNNLYIACDAGSDGSRIREVNTAGVIYTIAGNGLYGYGGDGGNPLLAILNNPEGVAVGNNGDIYIGDVGNYRVRLVTDSPLAVSNVQMSKYRNVQMWPNPVDEEFTIEGAGNSEMSIYDLVGQEVYKASVLSDRESVHIEFLPSGVYVVQIVDPATGLRVVRKVVKE